VAIYDFSAFWQDTGAYLGRMNRNSLRVTGLAGLAFCGMAAFLPLVPVVAMTVALAGVSLLLLAALGLALGGHARWLAARDSAQLDQLLGQNPQACALVGADDGVVLWCNATATERCALQAGDRLTLALADWHTEPESFVQTLHARAREAGSASHNHDLPGHQRIYHVEGFGPDQLLWRITLPRVTDWRDALPFQMLHFAADGRLSYASPDLRMRLGDMPFRLDMLFSRKLPEVGLATWLDTPHLPLPQQIIRLQTAARDAEVFLFLPTPKAESTPRPPGAIQPQNLPIGIAHLDADGQLLSLNEEARRLLQLRSEELPLLSDVLEGLGRPVTEWIGDISTRRVARGTEILRLSRNASETYLKVSLCLTDQSATTGLVAVLSDVTEFKSLEAKFTQSQKMQAIGQLAGGVAHDFNNLLTAIAGHCDLLMLRHDRHDPDYPDLMQIQQNCNRAAALVRQLLALSRKQSLQFVTLDLQETMDDVIHLLNRLVGEKITLSLRHGAGVAPIRSDKRQFEQVLMNLVVNARDALPMGGEIRIETRACPLPNGLERDRAELPPGEYTQIKISDDGTGIPQALLTKIFDPFFTTKRQGEGTGLGLSTVYGIVKQSGGYIFVDSEEGVGTTFTLYFAAQPRGAKQADSQTPALLQKSVRATPQALILLVEDEAPVRSFAARALELQGHRVLAAESGEAALEILRDPKIRPDCFVTDVIMPGLDGPGWIMEIRERFADTPVLFMSGYAEDSHIAAQARIGNAAFLGKPFSLVEFTDAVNAQLRKRHEAA
jgi:two-component system, cell cycle sensor histidine kinase and response regulator CckA